MYSIETVEVLGQAMEVFLFRPEGPGPHPALLYAMHIPGHNGLQHDKFTLEACRRYADEGYVVAVPFIFHWWSKDESVDRKRAESRDDWTVADMQAGFDLLKRQADVDPARIGVVGHCWGGRVAWLAASHLPEVRALAVFYGGNIKKPRGEGSVAPIERARDIPCPVIGFFGNDDNNPTPGEVEDYSAALADARVSHEFHQYDGAGHAFQNSHAPALYRAEASEDAWTKVLEFLGEQLGVRGREVH